MSYFKVLIPLLFFLIPTVVNGQAVVSDGAGGIYLNKNESTSSNDKKKGFYVGPHILGDSITLLINAFENKYVYFQETGGAYNTEEKIVNKPNIYKAVNKVRKHYEKSFKKGKVNLNMAYFKLNKVYRLGIRLWDYQTYKVEKEIKQLKTVEEIENYLFALKFK